MNANPSTTQWKGSTSPGANTCATTTSEATSVPAVQATSFRKMDDPVRVRQSGREEVARAEWRLAEPT